MARIRDTLRSVRRAFLNALPVHTGKWLATTTQLMSTIQLLWVKHDTNVVERFVLCAVHLSKPVPLRIRRRGI